MFGKDKQGKNIDRVVRDLYLKRGVWQAFKDDPEEVGATYRLSGEVIEAVKNGNWNVLVDQGMDGRLVGDPAYRLTDRVRLAVGRLVAMGLALVLGFVVMVPRARARGEGLRIAGRRMGRIARRLPEGTRAALRLGRRSRRLDNRYSRINHDIGQADANIVNDGSVTILDPVQ